MPRMKNNTGLALTLVIAAVVGAWLIISKTTRPQPQGMQPIQSHRSYTLELLSQTSALTVGQPSALEYRIKNDQGKTIKDFSIVHEKNMHLIVVRHDVTNFQHVHPDFNEQTGVFTASVVFPSDGPYRVFSDFTPAPTEDNPMQLPVVTATNVSVGTASRYQAMPLEVDTAVCDEVDGYTIEYALPASLRSQQTVRYQLLVSRGGKDVTDLELYLGALGHSVIIREGTFDYVHTHPENGAAAEMPLADHSSAGHMVTTARGPAITFSTTFPSPGRYKIFTQFKHSGDVYTTERVVEVE